jgi:hypothetical protein
LPNSPATSVLRKVGGSAGVICEISRVNFLSGSPAQPASVMPRIIGRSLEILMLPVATKCKGPFQFAIVFELAEHSREPLV